MDDERVKKEMQSLAKEIHRYNHAFFQEGKSLVSDYAFDELVRRLRILEERYPHYKQPDSPTMRVGEGVTPHFPTVVHRYPMYSLDNTYEEGEVEKFIQRVTSNVSEEVVDFFCELKVDGIALSLTYAQGRLVNIVTRGDGKEGDDITINRMLLRHIPSQIEAKDCPAHFTVRGEAFMPKQAFQKLNAYYATQGRSPLANPRNATAGLVRTKQLDPTVKKMRPLAFVPYGLLPRVKGVATQEQVLDRLGTWGFQVNATSQHCLNKGDIMRYIDYWEGQRDELPMMVDGIVVKVNSITQQATLGMTVKSPRWAVAYKYKPVCKSTRLRGVVFQVGRTGAITPVAIVAPVALAGTTVQRASLHNAQEIVRLQLRFGDHVFVEKGGDIIPKIVKVDRSKPNPSGSPILFPTHCPDCATPLVRTDGEANHYCPHGLGCPTQLKEKLLHFAHRKALNIASLGRKTLGLLVEKKLIQHPIDLFALQQEQLERLEGFQEKSAQKLLHGIQASREKSFQRVLFGLGIPHVGATVVQKLLAHFSDIDALMAATKEELVAIPEVGAKIAESLCSYFATPFYREQIVRLRVAGLAFATQLQPVKAGRALPLAGKQFVVSGIFTEHSREGIRSLIQEQGGKVVSAISSKVDWLVVGNKAGLQKLKKAKALGVALLAEKALKEMVTIL